MLGVSKPEKPVQPVEFVVLWRNRVDYLPDPSKDGDTNPGLVGQVFLFGPKDQFAPANGKLTVALYDETPRPPGVEGNKPEGWEFTKEALRGLITPDERFGMSYALFLPWPTYRPDVTRVRIAARFDPEEGFPLYAREVKITLDNTAPGQREASFTNETVVPDGRGGFSPLGGPPPAHPSMLNAAPNRITPPADLGFPGGPIPLRAPQTNIPIPVDPRPLQLGGQSPGAVPPGAPGTPVNPAALPPIAVMVPRQ
jgi:hypothetical protein